jgi:ethanolamine utilization protein EutQ (cupin superfamily)
MSSASMQVRKLTSDVASGWSQVADQQIFVNDLIDQAADPDAAMTVGFARLDKGATLDISFPYDEVLILTSGMFTVRTQQGETVTAHAGDVVYLPAESSNIFRAEADTEMVYVAHPPSVYAQWVRAAAGQ